MEKQSTSLGIEIDRVTAACRNGVEAVNDWNRNPASARWRRVSVKGEMSWTWGLPHNREVADHISWQSWLAMFMAGLDVGMSNWLPWTGIYCWIRSIEYCPCHYGGFHVPSDRAVLFLPQSHQLDLQARSRHMRG